MCTVQKKKVLKKTFGFALWKGLTMIYYPEIILTSLVPKKVIVYDASVFYLNFLQYFLKKLQMPLRHVTNVIH